MRNQILCSLHTITASLKSILIEGISLGRLNCRGCEDSKGRKPVVCRRGLQFVASSLKRDWMQEKGKWSGDIMQTEGESEEASKSHGH